VMTDVPCSGSGAWRRNPDAKWRLTPERLATLIETQDAVLDQAAGLVVAGGMIAYMTCSLFTCENADRIDAFLHRHPGWRIVNLRQITPLEGADGFFCAILSRV